LWCRKESFLFLLLMEIVKLNGIVLEWRRTDVVSMVKCSKKAVNAFVRNN
jgi:hypothetical protein